MKASDYIVEFLIRQGITDVFGYPGGMVTHLMDSFAKYQEKISAHVTYHEQGAAFAACGYAQVSGKVGVAYATSGPGATNLITGICNAYFDSIPTVFLTGQVNEYESKGPLAVRQRGFQETDIVSIIKPVTKWAVHVEKTEDLPVCLEKAFVTASSGRKGPVLLDIPMNVFREDLHMELAPQNNTVAAESSISAGDISRILSDALSNSSRPCILVGNGVKIAGYGNEIRHFIDRAGIPAVTSMIAFDVLSDDPYSYGFIGAYGTRTGNFIAAKSDLIISIGSRMDIRQVGVKREQFAPEAKIIRFDIDAGELEYPVHTDETQIHTNMESIVAALERVQIAGNYSAWVKICNEIRTALSGLDQNTTSRVIEQLGQQVPYNAVITTDVGQNQVWVAQSFKIKDGQSVLFSGGHGAMGYSLPAAIGAHYGAPNRPVLCITGDGGMQMNIQELQFVAKEKLPIKIVVLNNNALGMIRHFQEMYFNGRYFQTKPEGGYSAPDFSKIAKAYGIRGRKIDAEDEIVDLFVSSEPELLEVVINEDTYVIPKLEFGKPNQDQEPLIDRNLYSRLMNL